MLRKVNPKYFTSSVLPKKLREIGISKPQNEIEEEYFSNIVTTTIQNQFRLRSWEIQFAPSCKQIDNTFRLLTENFSFPSFWHNETQVFGSSTKKLTQYIKYLKILFILKMKF